MHTQYNAIPVVIRSSTVSISFILTLMSSSQFFLKVYNADRIDCATLRNVMISPIHSDVASINKSRHLNFLTCSRRFIMIDSNAKNSTCKFILYYSVLKWIVNLSFQRKCMLTSYDHWCWWYFLVLRVSSFQVIEEIKFFVWDGA